MSVTRRLIVHLSVALWVLLVLAARGAAQGTDVSGPANFVILVNGIRVGAESVVVAGSASGWSISGTGRLLPPLDLVTTKFELSYGSDWQARQLQVEGQLKGSPMSLATSFGVTTASNELLQGGQRASNSVTVSPRAVVLPHNFFGAYEALALRLSTSLTGTRVPIYVAPEAEISVTVTAISDRRIVLASGPAEFRDFALTFSNPSGPQSVSVWIDTRGRLARIAIETAGLTVIREDLASVMAREEGARNPGDEDVFIPGSGFAIGATITRPAAGAGTRAPAIVLIPSSGTQDRDGTVFGVPMLANLARALSNAGWLVVRYDKRGLGQSGGRVENAGLAEYAEDVVQIVNWLRRRRDVDGNRMAVAGYGDGGSVGLIAADRQSRIKALALVAAPGRLGRVVALEQQQRLLARLKVPESEKAAKIALQTRIIDATITGKGWEGVPSDLRRQADSAWFRAWLQFDPVIAIGRIDQPILVLQGALDAEVTPNDADQLAAASAARKKISESHTRKVVVAGVNHLLIPAKTGEIDEYATIDQRTVSADLSAALVSWLTTAVPGR